MGRSLWPDHILSRQSLPLFSGPGLLRSQINAHTFKDNGFLDWQGLRAPLVMDRPIILPVSRMESALYNVCTVVLDCSACWHMGTASWRAAKCLLAVRGAPPLQAQAVAACGRTTEDLATAAETESLEVIRPLPKDCLDESRS